MAIDDLQRRAIREARMADAATVAFQAELRRVFRRLTALLRADLADWDVDETGRTLTSVANLARVFALRHSARRLLRDAGFDALALAAVSDPLDELAVAILRGAGASVRLGPNVADALTAWKELRLADLLDVGDDVARVLQRIALDGTLGLRPIDRLILDVRDSLDVSLRQARTLYDTLVSTFARQVEVSLSSGEPDELFVYVGPVDEKARPFCLDLIGKVRTRTAIDTLDNGQLPDVFVTGGGYQCRHLFKRVSLLDQELIDIAGTEQRAPGIVTQLERLEAA